MKKTSFVAKSLIALLTVGMISCSGNDNAEQTADNATAAVSNENTTINIRYVDIDSVMAAYTLSVELGEQGRKLMVDYQRMENQKRNELQQLGNSIEQKRNSNGYLSQESFDADVNAFNRKQTEAANILQAQQNKIEKQIADFNVRLNDSIIGYIKEYNATRGYDAILYKASGLYFNPALDITGEIIEGLNTRYVPAEKK